MLSSDPDPAVFSTGHLPPADEVERVLSKAFELGRGRQATPGPPRHRRWLPSQRGLGAPGCVSARIVGPLDRGRPTVSMMPSRQRFMAWESSVTHAAAFTIWDGSDCADHTP